MAVTPQAQNGASDRGTDGATMSAGGQGGRGGFGRARGGFDANMTPEQREDRRKRLEERMAAMTPEERAAFQERMAQRAQNGGGRGGSSIGQPGNGPQAAGNQPRARGAGVGRIASTPSMSGTATTIDSLFGPLPVVETRGAAWLWPKDGD